jgi:membrane associated rhomboid family serine protease
MLSRVLGVATVAASHSLDMSSLQLASDFRRRAIVLAIFIGLLWFIHALDAPFGRDVSVAGTGVIPRTYDGLFGILTAPLIHESWGHLINNTLPLIVLGALILVRGIDEFLFVLLCTTLISGLGVWIFGASGNHIGASGLVYGFAGFLLFRSAFDRNWRSLLVTLVVAIGYSTVLASGLIPHDRISWTSHFFGFAGGFVAARLRYPARSTRFRIVDHD